MKLWLIHDEDPTGGHLSAQNWEPTPDLLRDSETEVRVTSIEQSLWDWFMEGNLPINEADPYNLDHVWVEYWDAAEVAWTRE